MAMFGPLTTTAGIAAAKAVKQALKKRPGGMQSLPAGMPNPARVPKPKLTDEEQQFINRMNERKKK